MRKVSDKIVKNIDHTNNSNTKILNNNKIVYWSQIIFNNVDTILIVIISIITK